ncbi:endonuclease [Paramagnetospirillum kuznetsovii]|uniref:Endonuclease n=1 Tax=Paramagnetospirillum kuznetsovii TaxID=2053833 RepID=A0A364P0P8_9PROT|nr:endonuclease/exonuclease/phosphatase family protein [Paramagnetospirillum kuznetsovii]RAU22901.1 endonuclease [Paramagnetospirillum kuznetsovii]
MVRIATFNLENLDDRPRGVIDFDDRLRVLRPQLQRLRADILCFQEINAHAQSKHGPRLLSGLDRLLEGTRYEGWHRVISLNRGGAHPSDLHNLVILSRHAPESHDQFWHDLVEPCQWRPTRTDPPSPSAMALEWDRPVLHAAFRLADGRSLHVINLHLRAPRAAWLHGQKESPGRWLSVAGWAEGFFMASVKQAGQALEVRLLVERLFDAEPDALIAVCGDFNATDREASLRIIRGDEEDIGNGHLAMRMLVPVERSLPESARFSVIHHGHPVLLDHIVVSRNLLGGFKAAELHNETLGDELVSPAAIVGPPESYHAPIVAEFEVTLA